MQVYYTAVHPADTGQIYRVGDSIIGHETKGTCEYRPQQNATIVKIKLTSQDQRFRLQTRQNAEAMLVDAQIDVMPLTKSMIS